MNMLINTQSKFAKCIAIDHVSSEQGETASSHAHRESPKPSEFAMYIELGMALTAVFGLWAMEAWVWYLKSPGWISSIHRLQDML